MKITELEERMKGHAKITKSIISAPFDLKTEINKMEGKNMSKPKNITWLKRVSTVAAVVTVCAITVVSAGAIKGMFKDVKRWDGAVIGTEYVNATNDIEMSINATKDECISLDISFENPNEAPFVFLQEVAITDYKIFDNNDKEVLEVNSTFENGIKGNVENGRILLELPTNDKLNSNQNYKLVVNTIYGLAKADQPLKITGTWECEFSR